MITSEESSQADLDSGDVEEDWFAEDTTDEIDEIDENAHPLYLPTIGR